MAKAGDGEERSKKRRTTHQLYKRVTAEELEAFKRRASDEGFASHQDYLTALILGDAGFERQDRHDLIRILGELGKQGSNLNQIAHAVNSGKITALSAEDLRMVEAARAAVDDVAAMLKEALK